MNKIFKHKRGASGLKVVCEFAKSHCSSGEKTAVSSGAHVSTRSGFKSLSIALISALTLGIATPAMAVVFGEGGYKGGSSTTNSGAVAGGNSARATAPGSTAIGVSVTASGGNSTAIGMNAESMTGQALAVGSYARARGDQSTAIGNDVTSIGKSSIAIGNDDISSVYNNNPLFTAEELAKKDIVDELDKLCAVASCESMYGFKKVGNSYTIVDEEKYNKWSPTFTTGAGAIAIGSRTVAMSDGATAIGTLAVAAGKKSAALGSFSKATAENALAFGAESIASGINSSVFGIGAKASKNNSIAIGTGAVSNIENSIALGVNSKTDYTGSDKRGYMPGNGYMLPMASSAGVISVGSATQPRRIVNLASGALDTDAVNVAQLKSLAENLGVDNLTDNVDKTMRYLSVSRTAGSAADIQNLIQKEKDFKTYSQYRKYHDIMVLGKKRTGTNDYNSEITDLETKIAQMEGKYTDFNSAIATPSGLTNINQNSSEQDVKTVTDSINAYTTTILTANEKTKIKSHNAANEGATGADAIAIGYDAQSTGAQAVSLGKTATASGTDAIAIGNGAKTKENAANAIAIGKSSNATDINTIAIGNNAKANGKSSINIGEGVAADNVLGANSVLIGSAFGDIAKTNTSLKIESSTIAGTDLKIEGKKIDKSVIIGSRHEIGQVTATTNELSQNVIVGEKIRLDNSDQAVTIGSDIIAKDSKGGIAIGGDDAGVPGRYQKIEIKGKGAMAIGSGSRAQADAAMSLGVFSNTTVADGVALGSNSTADRASIANNKTNAYNGSDTNVANTIKGSYGAVSVGNSDNTRQITNVAAGSADTDAVNVAQLKNNSFKVKGKDSADADTTNSIKSGKTVEFASADKYLKISHTVDNGDSKFTFDVDENELKKTIGATSTGSYALDFSGDTAGTKITRNQANKELKIKGGATATNLSTNNIGVEADATAGTLNIKLAKALKGLTSAEFSDSVKIGGATISGGTDNSLSFGNAKITNIAAGENDKDAVNKQQAKTIAQDEAKKAIDPTFLKNKIEAGTNIASIATEGTGDDAKLKINANGAKVEGVTDGFVTVTSSSETGNITKYTVDLKDDIKTKINDAANATANATSAMQSLNVKVGTDNAELNKNNNTLEFAAGNNLKVELDQANRKVTYKLADNLKFDNINAGKKGSDGTDGKVGVNGKDGSGVAIDGKDGKIVAHGENGENGKSVVINGKDGTIGAKGADGKDGVVINGDEHTIIAKGENGKDGVTINGKDGSIGLPGKDGTSANGVVIKSGDVVNGVDGTNGITRIVYTDKNGDHQVATLDDGIKFVGNNGDKALKLNKQFTIQGADANKDTGTATTVWNKFDAGANIMTKAEADGTENGRLTIALAKALKGLTSAEFAGGTAGGKTVINGDGVSYNKADNLNQDGTVKDPDKTVSIGKDGISAGGKTISNVGEAQKDTDAVNMKQMNETIKKEIATNNASTELTFVGNDGETKAKNGKITIAGGQTNTDKLSDKPNIGVVAKDGELNIKLAKDIEVDSVTAKDKITVGEGANKITIADGKITGITSAVDPNGDLAKKLADINSDTSKTDAEKAAKKKDAIQKALDSVVDNGSVATVGDLKNVTKGLDSVVNNVVTNVTNVTTNVNNITNVVTGGDSNIINKINNAKDAQKNDPNYGNIVEDNPLKTYNPYETTVKNNKSVVEAIKNINERGIKFIHVSDSDKVGKDDDVKLDSKDSQANQIGSIGIGMKAISDGKNSIATGTESTASGLNAIATGTNSIAMGTDAKAMGENTISIGKGNKVIGRNSGAIGDPSHIINVDGTYVVGNNNYIEGGDTTTVRDIFALGNNIGSDTKKVTDKANGSVILGSNGYSNVEHGVALGYGSNASVKKGEVGLDITGTDHSSDTSGVWKSTESAVSVGNVDNIEKKITRQITSVAAGTKDTDAVNVAQLKAVANQITAVTTNNGVTTSDQTFNPKTGRQVSYNPTYAPKVTNTGVNSVAIGANSVANRANTVSVGSAGNERIIANVADGVAPTDAANMRQLQSVANMVGEVKKDAMAGTASAMAIGNLPQATIPGKGMMAIGAGYYKGQTATALGVSKMSENGRWVFKASASYDSQRNVGAAGAIGFHF